jgi:thiol-disulfide isomerase/thioredoxin
MKRLSAFLAALMMCALTGCGAGEPAAAPPAGAPAASSPATTPSTSDSAPASASAAPDVPEALRFTGKTLDGAAFDGASLAGKPVVFWFWAPWCPKCLSEGPAVAATARKHAGDVTFVGVAGLDDDKRQMTEFVGRTGTSEIVHLDDREGAVYRHFRVAAQSAYVLVSPSGKRATATGPLDEKELAALIEENTR